MLARSQAVDGPPVHLFQTPRGDEDRVVDGVPVGSWNGNRIPGLLAEVVAETPGFEQDSGINANVPNRFLRMRRFS
jgi:hypothetical protein